MSKIKNILKLFTIGTIFVLIGCETEKEFLNPSPNSYVIKEYSFKKAETIVEFKSATIQLDDKLRRFQRQKRQSSNTNSSREIADLASQIDSTTVKEIDMGDYKSYTMLLSKENPNQDYFENIVIEFKPNQENKAYILKYTPDPNIPQNNDNYTVTGKIETVAELVYRGTSSFFGTNQYGDEIGGGDYSGGSTFMDCVTIMMCREPWFNQGVASEHVATSQCGNTYPKTVCTPIYGGSGMPTSSGYGGGTIHSPGSGGGISNGAVTTTSTPVTVTVTPPKPPDEKKCLLFNKLKVDAPFKNIVNTLKNATTQASINYEQGVALTNQPNGTYNAIVGTPDPDLDYSVTFNIPTGTTIDIMIHNHYAGGLTIFSPADLKQVYDYIKTADIDQGDNYVSVVVTPNPQDPQNPTVYAMTITDRAKFIAYGVENFSTETKFNLYDVLFYTNPNPIVKGCLGINGDHSAQDNEKKFLKMIKESGLKVHKANVDLSQWNPLGLTNNGVVVPETPCN